VRLALLCVRGGDLCFLPHGACDPVEGLIVLQKSSACEGTWVSGAGDQVSALDLGTMFRTPHIGLVLTGYGKAAVCLGHYCPKQGTYIHDSLIQGLSGR
jgi:hypothetical protein